MVSDRPKVIEDAIQGLDDYLTLFPYRSRAREVRDSFSGRLCQRLSALVYDRFRGGAID
jgi:hypothetical protein